MRSFTVVIRLNEMTAVPKELPPWELAVLEAVHENTEIISEGVWPHELPDARAEFDRLEKVYGVQDDTKQSYASLVYGAGVLGIRALRKAIADEAAIEPEEVEEVEEVDPDGEEPDARKPAKKAAKKAARKSASAD